MGIVLILSEESVNMIITGLCSSLPAPESTQQYQTLVVLQIRAYSFSVMIDQL